MAMTAKQALAELEQGRVWPVYYLYGDEPFKIQEFVERVTASLFSGGKPSEKPDLSFCVDRLEGPETSGADVLDSVRSLGLFGAGGGAAGRGRLVVVRQAAQLREVEPLFDALKNLEAGDPWGGNALVLVAETLDGRRKFHQWLKKRGFALELKPARDAELAQWVQFLARRHGAKVAPDAAELLAVVSDGSLHRLALEIEKAWLHAGGSGCDLIRVEDVAATCVGDVTQEMWELVSAIIGGRRARSLLLCERLVRAPEHAIGLVGFLTWAMKNPGRGAGPLPARGGTARALQAKLLDRLIDLDQSLKSSPLDAGALVERFIIEQTEGQTSR